MFKLTDDQHVKVVELLETIESERPNQGILDITLAIMESLKTVAFMETSMPVSQLKEQFKTWER